MRRIIKLKYFNASRHRLFIFATIFIIVATILIVSLTTSKGISSSSDDDDEKGDGDENDEIKKQLEEYVNSNTVPELEELEEVVGVKLFETEETPEEIE